jgi:hypothetical protein
MASRPTADTWLDAQEIGLMLPGTFMPPTKAELNIIRAGDRVKLNNGRNAFWVVVSWVNDTSDPFMRAYNAIVSQELIDTGEYPADIELRFLGRNVYNISPAEIVRSPPKNRGNSVAADVVTEVKIAAAAGVAAATRGAEEGVAAAYAGAEVVLAASRPKPQTLVEVDPATFAAYNMVEFSDEE